MFEKIINTYSTFKESLIEGKYIHEGVWNRLIEKWSTNSRIELNLLGKSEEGRNIHEIKIGEGPIKICMWSQMHGNEATATMALADFIQYLSIHTPETNDFYTAIKEELSIHIIPLVNPDGQFYWTRETSLGIDMNRDARKKASKEGKLLFEWANNIQPDFAFNLHDQNRLYSVGNTGEQTHFAFLAPPFDEENTWSEGRTKAAQIANHLIQLIEPIYPGKIARWTDEFEPRAFGDTFQKMGFGVLLIEAGGMKYDFNKMELRKYETALLAESIRLILTKEWQKENLEEYNRLRINTRNIFDLKVLNIKIKESIVDLGFNIEEVWNGEEFTYRWTLEDLGDLSTFASLHEWDNQQSPINFQPILGKEYNNLEFYNSKSDCFKLDEIIKKIH